MAKAVAPVKDGPFRVYDQPEVRAAKENHDRARAEVDRLSAAVLHAEKKPQDVGAVAQRAAEMRGEGKPTPPTAAELRLDLQARKRLLEDSDAKLNHAVIAASAAALAPGQPDAVRFAELQQAVADSADRLLKGYAALRGFEEDMGARGLQHQMIIAARLTGNPEIHRICMHGGILERIVATVRTAR